MNKSLSNIATGAAIGGLISAGMVTVLASPALPGNQVYTSAAAIRLDNPSTGYMPTIHQNGSHPAPNIDRISIERGDMRHGQTPGVMRVHFEDARSVLSPKIVPDEAMIATNITCGISGGVQYANVYCYDHNLDRYLDFFSRSDRARMGGQSQNWWFELTSTGSPR